MSCTALAKALTVPSEDSLEVIQHKPQDDLLRVARQLLGDDTPNSNVIGAIP